MRKVVLFISLVLTLGIMAQSETTNQENSDISVKKDTKYEKFFSNYGSFLRFAEYKLPKFDFQKDWINETSIREFIDVNTGKKSYFLRIRSGYPRQTESIAYEDLIKVIDAIKQLKAKFADDSQIGNYMEFRFTTEDGMQIGYYYSDNKPTWFMSVKGDTRYFKKDFDFEKAFVNAKTEIERLMAIQ